MNPIVKCQDDMVVLVVNRAQAHIIRTMFGAMRASNKEFVDPVYDAMIPHFPHPLPHYDHVIDFSQYT